MSNVINLINAIRDEASLSYQERIPQASRENLAQVGDLLASRQFKAQYLEFCEALVGVIGLTIIKAKLYQNKLAMFKRGDMPLGSTIQEIAVNMASAEGSYDPTGPNPLGRRLSDIKALYFDKAREDKYVKSLSRTQIRNGFRSEADLERLLNEIVNSIYSGANLDEYLISKEMLAKYKDYYYDVAVNELNSATNDKAFIKKLKVLSSDLTYVHTKYNPMALKTFTDKADQVLFIKADSLAELDVEVLANIFNMQRAELPVRIIEVDSFGDDTNSSMEGTIAILCDKDILNVYDKDVFVDNQHNADGAFDNYFLHVHQIYFMDFFSNAIRLVKSSNMGTMIDVEGETDAVKVTSMVITDAEGVARPYVKAYKGDTITITGTYDTSSVSAISIGDTSATLSDGTFTISVTQEAVTDSETTLTLAITTK